VVSTLYPSTSKAALQADRKPEKPSALRAFWYRLSPTLELRMVVPLRVITLMSTCGSDGRVWGWGG
jgi:hypothetical protein